MEDHAGVLGGFGFGEGTLFDLLRQYTSDVAASHHRVGGINRRASHPH